ncbi:DUF4835 family protein [Dokdonia sp.]|uniref:type IX secretion system protein PorD n=1 Tax=Dokdonia sp. TaxID=2024995 RepID=UPI003265DCA9
MKTLIGIFAILCTLSLQAQELNAVVIINAEQTGKAELQVFKTLERSLTEFINNTKWTDRKYKQQERVECSFNIIVQEINSDAFRASVQVQSSRPIFNTNYDSPIFNFNDRDFDFDYVEFQPLIFNPNTFDSNLVSVISYYVYTILGYDSNTFKKNDGDKYFQIAKQIVTTAQSGNNRGWKPQDGPQSRYRLNEDLLSPNFREFSDVLYGYHRSGLDLMADDNKKAKQAVLNSITKLKAMYNKRPNNFLNRVFFDSKAEEIASMFSGGPQIPITDLLTTLNRIAPTKSSFWRQISF